MLTMNDVAAELQAGGYLPADIDEAQAQNRVRTWRKRGLMPEADDVQLGHPVWKKKTITKWALARWGKAAPPE